jgi:hypothetical protein
MALLRVALRLPNSRPWKPDLKDRTDSWGLPGDWLSMHDSAPVSEAKLDEYLPIYSPMSSLEKSAPGPRSFARYAMNAALNAVSTGRA